MNQKYIIALALLLALALIPSDASAWYNPSWSYQAPINVTNNNASSTLLFNYSVNLTFNHAALVTAGKSNANGSDLVVVENNLTSLGWYNITPMNTTTTTIVFRTTSNISAGASNTTGYELYYGNPAATTTKNGDAAYLFFDDATGTFSNKWTNVAGTSVYGTAGGLPSIAMASNAKIRNKVNWTGAFILDADYYGNGNMDINIFENGTEPNGDISGMGARMPDIGGNEAILALGGVPASWESYSIANTWSTHRMTNYPLNNFTIYSNISTTTVRNYTFTAKTAGLLAISNYGGTSNNITNIKLRRYLSPEPTAATGAEVSTPLNPAPIITITNPTNTTYFISKNFWFNFSASNATNIKAYIDGAINYTNLTYTSGAVSFQRNLSLYQHNFSVWANNTGGNGNQTDVLFTVKDYQLDDTTYQTMPYETTPYNYSAILKVNFDVISNISSQLFFNSTNQGYGAQTINATHIVNTQQATIPLLNANATNFTHYWNTTVTYLNGTIAYWLISNNTNQTAQYAYFLSNPSMVQSSNSMIEREDFTNTLTVTALKTYATLSANTTYNGTGSAMTPTSYNIFTQTIDSGNISDGINNDTFFTFANLTVTFGGNSRVMNSEVDNISAFKIILTNCTGASTTPTLNLSLMDEANSSAITGTIEIMNNVWKTGELTRIYSYTFPSITGANICIYPAWANYTLSSFIQYYAPGYSERTYFIDAAISNISQAANLYLLSSANSYSTIFFLRDQNNNPYTDAIIQVQRYFTGTNTYKTVAQCKSDSPTGKCTTYMQILDVYYRYVISKNLTVVKTTTPSTIICTSFESITFCPPYPIPITISTLGIDNYFLRVGKVSVSVSVNNATNILSATVVDTSGTMTASSLSVDQKGALSFYNICNSTASSSATTFTCDLGNRTGNIYQYDFIGLFDGKNVTLQTNLLDYTSSSMEWGLFGPLLAFIIIGTLYFMRRDSPIAAMVYAGVGLVLTFAIGITPVALTSLIGLFVVIAILVWEMK